LSPEDRNWKPAVLCTGFIELFEVDRVLLRHGVCNTSGWGTQIRRNPPNEH
jgi:hypothetical protein